VAKGKAEVRKDVGGTAAGKLVGPSTGRETGRNRVWGQPATKEGRYEL